jgi:phosphoribosyl 1,2-cyclic phosphodiesterase
VKLGAYAYVTKPFITEEILSIVEGYFSNRKIQIIPPAIEKEQKQQFTVALENTKPYIRFWGTRGSIPVSGAPYVRYGGNTPCLEINDGHSTIIIDAGTGIRELGVKLMNEPPRPLHLFIGHTHWDHIQGFPFFTPAYRQDTSLIVFGASGFGKDLRSIFSGQLDADYFPVQLQDLPSSIEFREMKENPIVSGTLNIHWCYVHHQGAALGFKFMLNGKTIVYITDNEFLKGYCGAPDIDLVPPELLEIYSDLIRFISNADLLISESQYTDSEYVKKIGWGHTSLSNGCLLCKLGNVKQWIVTHHEPMHTDELLDNKLFFTEKTLESIGYMIPVSNATDGLIEYF